MRKEKSITVSAEGRDKGKQFKLREMSATQAESWAIRVMLAIGSSGIEIPDGLARQGFAGLLVILNNKDAASDELVQTVLSGLRVALLVNLLKIPYEKAEPLLEEMMACAQIVEPAITRGLMEGDVEEVSTLLMLRKEIWGLHSDFFTGAGPLTSGSDQPAKAETSSTIKPRPPRSPQ